MTTTRFASRGRIAAAIAGIAALVTTMLVQSVDTAAQFTDVATANSSFEASDDFWPTPVIGSLKCEQKHHSAEDKPYISWTAPAGSVPSGSWRYRIVMHEHDGNKFTGDTYTYANNYNGLNIYLTDNSTLRGKSWYARVHTINGPKVSSGYRGAGMWYNAALWNLGNCTGNYEFVENHAGFNSLTAGAETLGDRSRENLDKQAADANVEASAAQRQSDTVGTRDESEVEVSATASAEIPKTNASTSMRSATQASSPRTTATSTRQSSTIAHTRTAAPSVVVTTSTPPTSVPASTAAEMPVKVRLPGGGEAEIIGDTKLVVTGAQAEVCSATVRKGSALKVRNGALEVADENETRVVDLATCELT